MGALRDVLSADHDRLDALWGSILRADGAPDTACDDAFRRGLLRHISIEERVLFPVIRKQSGETALLAQLHRDHAALAALLVPPPTAAEVAAIGAILTIHNELEERAGGLYEVVESIAGRELDALMRRVDAIPEVPLMPHVDTALVRDNIAFLWRAADEGRRRLLDADRR